MTPTPTSSEEPVDNDTAEIPTSDVPEEWKATIKERTPTLSEKQAKAKAERPPQRTGRPTLLTPELMETVVDLLKRGNYISTAAKAVGLNPATISQWVKKGNDLAESGYELDEYEQAFVIFAQEIEKARSYAQIKAVEVIRNAMPSQWQAAAWYLERTDAQNWGRTVKTELTGADGGAIQVDVDGVMRKLQAVTQRVIDAEIVAGDTPNAETPADGSEI